MMLKNSVFGYLQKQARLQFDIGYLHERAFFALMGYTGVAVWAWVVYHYQQANLASSSVILLIMGIFGLGLFIYRISQRSHLLATYVFLLAQCLYITSMQQLLDDPTLSALFMLVVVMAGALIGPFGAFVFAGLAIVIQGGLAIVAPHNLSQPLGLVGFVAQISLTAMVSWLSSLGLFEALEGAEASAQKARQHAAEVRENRAKLKRALKSLDLVNYQLERANYELFQSREVIDAALQFKRKFAAQISHELLTSLNLIFGFSETITFAQHTYGTPLPKAYLRDVTEIHRNSRHLLALIDDILDLSKLEAGQLGLHCEPVDLGLILREALDIVHPLLETKGLTLRQQVPTTFPSLMLDSGRIRQVLLNLLSNAARVTAKGGIIIQADVQVHEVVVYVKDTGPGISAEDLQRIFEEFQQSDALAGAAGLGLAVSKQIVNLHGGRMWAESEVGRGSTFALAFPIIGVLPAAPTHQEVTQTQRTTHPTFIVVGDKESDEVKLLQRHLEGFALTPAPTWEAALPLISAVGARAVVAPTEAIPEGLSPPVPLIRCDLPGPQKAAKLMDIADYIRKPVTLGKLTTVLSRVAPAAQSILVVDDEPAAVRLIKRIIQASDNAYQVAHAYSGQAAWTQIQAQKPDLLLLDLAMPEGNGRWLISRLKADPRLANITVIAISGQVTRETFESGPISIESKELGVSETLDYLRALLSATPPAKLNSDATVPASLEVHPASQV